MTLPAAFSLLLLGVSAFAQDSIVNAVRAAIARHDLRGAEEIARAYESRAGARPDLAAALSWLARAQLATRDFDRADALAAETTQMANRLLAGRKLDADPWLPTAVGAAIEVHAQVLAARGERADAVAYLQEQSKTWGSTSLVERIRKNINLLSLEGKPAPALDIAHWIGSGHPPSLAALRGRPVLLFFWAHWCSDCKAEVATIADLWKEFAPQKLAVIGPTRLYGYVEGGEDAPPEAERHYIEQVRARFYGALADMPAPLNASNFAAYGASSTPTLVLIDRDGVVRWYHPGAASAAEIRSRILQMLAK